MAYGSRQTDLEDEDAKMADPSGGESERPLPLSAPSARSTAEKNPVIKIKDQTLPAHPVGWPKDDHALVVSGSRR